MDLLHQTIWEFETFEKERLFRFLKSGTNDSPVLDLYNLFTSTEKPFREKDLGERIYADANSKSDSRRVSMLRHRLMEKLSDFLISEQFLEKHNAIDDKTAARIRATKSLGVFFALHRKQPGSRLAMKFLKAARHLSLTHEFYPLLLYALYWEKTVWGHGNLKEIIRREKEIDEYELKWQGFRKAVHYFYMLTAMEGKSGKLNFKKISRFHKKAIRELKMYHRKTKLPIILYYMKYLLLDDCQNKKQYRKALEHLYDIETLMEEHPEISSVERTGFLNDNYALIYMSMKDYKNSLKHIRIAQNNLKKNTVDTVLSQEQEFMALIHWGKSEEAKLISEIMQRNIVLKTERYKHLHDKAKFYTACALYSQKNYKEALKIIKGKLSIVQDKEGWAFSLRLLEFYLLFETNSMNEIKHCLKRLDKFIEYHGGIHKRNKIIMRVISLLRKSDFTPDGRTQRKIKQDIKLLKSNNPDYCWQPVSDEVIRFDYWMERNFPN